MAPAEWLSVMEDHNDYEIALRFVFHADAGREMMMSFSLFLGSLVNKRLIKQAAPGSLLTSPAGSIIIRRAFVQTGHC